MESRLPLEVAIAMKLPFGALWSDALALVSARTALKSTETGILQRKEIREACEGKAVARVEVFSDETIDINVSFEDTSKLLSHKHAERIIDVEQPEELPESTSKELPDDGDVEE